MSEKDNNKAILKSLLDRWNTEFDKLAEIQTDSAEALKDLKQTLKKSWGAFEQRLD